jgi:hypothetical protein
MPNAWNMFVKKIYEEGKAKDSNYEFKQALVDASKRKSEMGQSSSAMKKRHKRNRTAKRGKSRKALRGRRSRRR